MKRTDYAAVSLTPRKAARRVMYSKLDHSSEVIQAAKKPIFKYSISPVNESLLGQKMASFSFSILEMTKQRMIRLRSYVIL